MKKVILGLGSNQGHRLDYLRKAIGKLRSIAPLKIQIIKISPIYESYALLPPGAPANWDLKFLNLAVLCETTLDASELLREIKTIEGLLGRQKRERWAPREIDIDILDFGNISLKSESLTIPHPGLLDRPFALLPFSDLAPNWLLSGKPAQAHARRWRHSSLNQVEFETQRTGLYLTEIMGILNLTPDSFSDGGRFPDPSQALAQIEALSNAGATVIDIGAESTRPGAATITPDEEWQRLKPLLKLVPKERCYTLSIDTRNAATAKKALDHGADWINDVTAGSDPEMIKVVAQSRANYVFMHSLSVPPIASEHLALEIDTIDQLKEWAEEKVQKFEKHGLSRDRLILDPGLGFGKTFSQNMELLRDASRLHDLGLPLLMGHSRKSYISKIAPGTAAADRDLETAVFSHALDLQTVNYLRVHQVEMTHRVLRAGSWLK